jgi:hypothetical protein
MTDTISHHPQGQIKASTMYPDLQDLQVGYLSIQQFKGMDTKTRIIEEHLNLVKMQTTKAPTEKTLQKASSS